MSPYLVSALIVVATFVLGYFINRFFTKLIDRSTEFMHNDPTNYLFLRHTLLALIYIIGIATAIYHVPELRALSQSLLAGAGILAVAVGFASQHALSNIISGIFIVIFKPFRINDRLHVKNLDGIVEDITLRHTVIRDFDNRRILIPNTVISDEVIINADYEDENLCKRLNISISYESDIDLAKKIMAEEVASHPLHIDIRTSEQKAEGEPEVPVKVIELGEYAVVIRAWAWTENAAQNFELSCDVLESIKKRFDKEGIEIPYPHRTIVQKKGRDEV